MQQLDIYVQFVCQQIKAQIAEQWDSLTMARLNTKATMAANQ
ncbi:MAG: hypothetical protein VYB81_08565 [Pseudomonadota bacterium]|nr:hypothetical protein [Pseudomonadota bacterium]